MKDRKINGFIGDFIIFNNVIRAFRIIRYNVKVFQSCTDIYWVRRYDVLRASRSKIENMDNYCLIRCLWIRNYFLLRHVQDSERILALSSSTTGSDQYTT